MKTLLLDAKPYRILKRYKNSISLQPIDSEYPHTILMQDPVHHLRWGHSVGGNTTAFYRRVSDDLFTRVLDKTH